MPAALAASLTFPVGVEAVGFDVLGISGFTRGLGALRFGGGERADQSQDQAGDDGLRFHVRCQGPGEEMMIVDFGFLIGRLRLSFLSYQNTDLAKHRST